MEAAFNEAMSRMSRAMERGTGCTLSADMVRAVTGAPPPGVIDAEPPDTAQSLLLSGKYGELGRYHNDIAVSFALMMAGRFDLDPEKAKAAVAEWRALGWWLDFIPEGEEARDEAPSETERLNPWD